MLELYKILLRHSDSIDDDVTALVASVSITVSGSTVTYNMPSALSGLSALSAGATMPSVATAITTVTDYRDEIIALPDLAQAGTDVDAAYATQTAAIATAMADIASNFPASSALVTPLTTMIVCEGEFAYIF